MADKTFVIRMVGKDEGVGNLMSHIGRIADHAIGNLVSDAFRVAGRQLEQFGKFAIKHAADFDVTHKAVKDLGESADQFGENLGRVLGPGLVAASAFAKDLTDKFSDFLEKNREFLSLKVGEAFLGLAHVAIPAVAGAAATAAQAIGLLIEGFQVVRGAAAEFELKAVTDEIKELEEHLGRLQKNVADNGPRMFGDASAVERTKKQIADLRQEYNRLSNTSLDASRAQREAAEMVEKIKKNLDDFTISGMESLTKATADFQKAMAGGLGRGDATEREKKRLKEEKELRERLNKEIEEDADAQLEEYHERHKRMAEIATQTENLKFQETDARRAFEKKQGALELAENEDRFKREVEAFNQKEALKRELSFGTAQNIAASFDAAFQAAIGSTENFGAVFAKVMLQATVDSVQRAIISSQAAAIEAAILAGASVASTPFIGPVLAIAAAASVGGALKALISQIPTKKAHGGIIGGSGAADDVPALLTRGESVLTRSQTREILGGRAALVSANGGAPSGGQNITVNYSPRYDMLTPPSRSVIRRNFRDEVAPVLAEVQRKQTGIRRLQA